MDRVSGIELLELLAEKKLKKGTRVIKHYSNGGTIEMEVLHRSLISRRFIIGVMPGEEVTISYLSETEKLFEIIESGEGNE